jgi:hypothetical protein
MGHFITLTPHPVTINLPAKGNSYQSLWTVIDISGYDILDLELGVLFLSSKVVANFYIETSMQNQTDSASHGNTAGDWLVAGTFQQNILGNANSVPNPQWQKLNIASGASSQGFLKYIRWRVNLNAAGTVTFFIRGIARTWGR